MTCGNFSTEKDTKNDNWLSSDDRLLITFNFMALRIKSLESVGCELTARGRDWHHCGLCGVWWQLETPALNTSRSIWWPDSIIPFGDQTLSYHLMTRLYHTIWWPDSIIQTLFTTELIVFFSNKRRLDSSGSQRYNWKDRMLSITVRQRMKKITVTNYLRVFSLT